MPLATGQGHLTSWTATPHISSVTQLCFLKQPLDKCFRNEITKKDSLLKETMVWDAC